MNCRNCQYCHHISIDRFGVLQATCVYEIGRDTIVPLSITRILVDCGTRRNDTFEWKELNCPAYWVTRFEVRPH